MDISERKNLQGAKFEGADLERAQNLSVYQFSKVKTLYATKLDEELLISLKEKYSVLFEKPEWISRLKNSHNRFYIGKINYGNFSKINYIKKSMILLTIRVVAKNYVKPERIQEFIGLCKKTCWRICKIKRLHGLWTLSEIR